MSTNSQVGGQENPHIRKITCPEDVVKAGCRKDSNKATASPADPAIVGRTLLKHKGEKIKPGRLPIAVANARKERSDVQLVKAVEVAADEVIENEVPEAEAPPLKTVRTPFDLAKLHALTQKDFSLDPDRQKKKATWEKVSVLFKTGALETDAQRGSTGRIKASNPPLQGLPRDYRYAVALDGKVMVYSDFKGLHPRILALLSGDEHLIRDIQGDVYEVVCEMLEVEFNPASRIGAKVAVLAWLNGASDPETIYEGFKGVKPVVDFIKKAEARWPTATKHRQGWIDNAHNTLTTEQLEKGAHLAVAYKLQKIESDILDGALAGLITAGEDVYLPMHDGILLTASPKEVSRVVAALREHMETPQYPISIDVGTSWGNATPFDPETVYVAAIVPKVADTFEAMIIKLRDATTKESHSIIQADEHAVIWGSIHGGGSDLTAIAKRLGKRSKGGEYLISLINQGKSFVAKQKIDKAKGKEKWIHTALTTPGIVYNRFGQPDPYHTPTAQALISAYCVHKYGDIPRYDTSLESIYIGDVLFDERGFIAELNKVFAEKFGWSGMYRKPLKEDFVDLAFMSKMNSLVDALNDAHAAWDGIYRVKPGSKFCQTYLGAKNPQLIDDIFMCAWLVGIINRAYVPGCDCAIMPILQGLKKGEGKDWFYKTLGKIGLRQGVATRTGSLTVKSALGTTDAMRILALKIIVTTPEGVGLSRKNQEMMKHAIAETHDIRRPLFIETMTETPRRGVLCSSTNELYPLYDEAKERRLHVIEVDRVPRLRIDGREGLLLERDLLQIYGELVHLFKVVGMRPRLSASEQVMQREASSRFILWDMTTSIVEDYLMKRNGQLGQQQLMSDLKLFHSELNFSLLVGKGCKVWDNLRARGWSNAKSAEHGRKWRNEKYPMVETPKHKRST